MFGTEIKLFHRRKEMKKRKTIIQIVRDKKPRLKDPTVAQKNETLSQAAVIGGMRSVAWRRYMEQFIDTDFPENDDQLMRLLGTDGTDTDPGLNRARAYLVANGTCGQGTQNGFDANVEGIDAGLPVLEIAE
jgi:hypothetical protein